MPEKCSRFMRFGKRDELRHGFKYKPARLKYRERGTVNKQKVHIQFEKLMSIQESIEKNTKRVKDVPTWDK